MKRKATQELKRSSKRTKFRAALGKPFPGPFVPATTELKEADSTNTGLITFNQTTANKLLLFNLNQGNTAATRVGRRIVIENLSWIFTISLAPTTTGSSSIRMLIVYDKQTNGAAPATVDVVFADGIQYPMNLNNGRRFKIIADEVYDGISDKGPGSFIKKGFRDFTAKGTKKGLEVEFKDSSGNGIADIITGSIYAFFWQDGGLLVASPLCNFFTRMRYADS